MRCSVSSPSASVTFPRSSTGGARQPRRFPTVGTGPRPNDSSTRSRSSRTMRCWGGANRPGRHERTHMNIGVVGLGYVGLPLAVNFAEAGDDVVAVDLDPTKVQRVNAADSYIEDIPSERLAAVTDRIKASTRYAELARCEAIVIAVPTPLTPNREPDLDALLSAAAALRDYLQRGQLIVLESTTYPGTTRERLVPTLEESGMRAGVDFNVAFSPERVDPGRTDFTTKTTPKVLGGLTEACGDRAEALYSRICDTVVRVSTPEAAELTKLIENVFRSVNIAMVNELSMLTERMGI